MLDLYDPANWDTPLFPIAVAAQAAMVAPTTIRQWIARGRVKLWEPKGEVQVPDAAKADDGSGHLLSLRGVLHISAAARLIAKGVDVADAYAATLKWAHFGDMSQPGHWVGEPEPTVTRLPAGLFADPAWTFLIHYSGDNARVVPVARDGEALPFKFSDLFAQGHPVYTPPTIIFLNMLDRYVRGICEGYLRPVADQAWGAEEIAKLIAGDA